MKQRIHLMSQPNVTPKSSKILKFEKECSLIEHSQWHDDDYLEMKEDYSQ
jgi:hypothetical protein